MSDNIRGSEKFITLQTLRFLTVGGLVFGLDITAVWVLQWIAPPLLAVSLAYITAVILHFWLNRQWVFKDRDGNLAEQTLRYVFMSAIGWMTTLILVELNLRTFTKSVVIAKLLAIPFVTILSFSLLKWFVFPARKT